MTRLHGIVAWTCMCAGAFVASGAQAAAAQANKGSTAMNTEAPATSAAMQMLSTGNEHGNEGLKLRAAGDHQAARQAFDQAIRAYREAIKLDPRLADAYRSLGIVQLLGFGAASEAVDSLRHAVELRPTDAQAWNVLGRAYHQVFMPEPALWAMEQAVTAQQGERAYLYDLGVLYIEFGRFEDAQRLIQAMVSLDKDLAAQLSAGLTQQVNKTSALSQAWPMPATPANPKIELVWIPPGRFKMGSTFPQDVTPVHDVTIAKGFYMGKYEVTQAQWQTLMGANPSHFASGGPDCPVEQVSWNDVQEFIRRINLLNDGYKYRLPTEAEWEYAYRAGTTGSFYAEGEIGWYDGNSGLRTHPVGGKPANAFGLHDMSGNVQEWCQDWYRATYEAAHPDGSALLDVPVRTKRVLRGGNFYVTYSSTSAEYRDSDPPAHVSRNNGFRVVAEKSP